MRQILGEHDVPGEPNPLEDLDEHVSPVRLARIQADPRGSGEGMMIVVPGLAHGRDRGPGDVMGLDPRTGHEPALRAAPMRQMAYEPVAGHRSAHPGANAPHDPAPP